MTNFRAGQVFLIKVVPDRVCIKIAGGKGVTIFLKRRKFGKGVSVLKVRKV